MTFLNIVSPVAMSKYIELWISEDTPTFDLSSFTISNENTYAHIEMKVKCVLAGLPFVEAIFKYLDCSVEWKYEEGTMVESKSIVAKVYGSLSKMLQAERTALNILSRACGVATIAKRVSNKVNLKWKGEISSSRKISPGMKMVEMYAMYVGGMIARHYDISTVVAINNSNIKIHGSMTNIVKVIKDKLGQMIMVEAKCGTKQEAIEAVSAGVDIVMLDCIKSQDVKIIAQQIKDTNSTVLVGVSGAISENNILEYAITNVDVICSNIFSQGYRSCDVSFIVADNEPLLVKKIEATNSVITPIVIEVVDSGSDNDLEMGKEKVTTLPIVPTKSIHKAPTKRKLDEGSIKTEDSKINATTIDCDAIKENQNDEDKVNTHAPKSNTVPPSKYSRQNTTNFNGTAKKHRGVTYDMKSLGSVRMPGFPVAITTQIPRVNNGKNSTIFGSMATGLALTFGRGVGVGSRSQAFLRRSTTTMVRYEASLASQNVTLIGNAMHRLSQRRLASSIYRTSTSSSTPASSTLRNFCRRCNLQNPMNGGPVCRLCRNVLI